MNRCLRSAAIVAILAGIAAAAPVGGWSGPSASQPPGGCVLRAELSGVVSGGMADYLSDAVAEAEANQCALLVVVDTPGGQLDATRRITRAFLGARTPVLVYVAPRGARAGSAGVFITMAGHVAAMAPGTNIGAAHPVVGLGGDPGEAMGEKIRNDTAAFARSIAETRGRNAEWAERAVLESVSATASEALALNVIDRVEPAEEALLLAVDGEAVEVAGGGVVELATADARPEPFEMTFRQSLIAALGDPELAYLLLMLGLLGLLVELSNPGILIPGIAGAIALFLAAIGLEILPVSAAGLTLLALGLGLLIAEVFFTSYGLLALGGLVSLVFGSILLVDRDDAEYFADQELVVSWEIVVPLALVMTGAAVALAWKLRRSQTRASPTGTGGLVGSEGVALEDVAPEGGAVRVGSERWSAKADTRIPARSRVEVVGIDGLELRVRRAGGERRAARGAEEKGTTS